MNPDESDVPPGLHPESDSDHKGPGGTDKVQSKIDYPENPTDLVVFDDDFSWHLLAEASKLASNTASFSYVVAPDGPLGMLHCPELLLC